MAKYTKAIPVPASIAQGDVLYYNGTNWARLGAGTNGQFLETLGAGANPTWATAGSDSTVSINLTNAQLLALNSSPVTVLAAQGANTLIEIVRVKIALDNAAGVYVGGGTLTLSGCCIAQTLQNATFMTGDASSSKAGYVNATVQTGLASYVNQPLTLTNATADFTGGNAANKATVTLIYRVMSTLPA